jgi:hypothetical protein
MIAVKIIRPGFPGGKPFRSTPVFSHTPQYANLLKNTGSLLHYRL